MLPRHGAAKAPCATTVPLMPPSLLQLIVHLRTQCGRNQVRAQRPPLEKKTGLLRSPSHQKKLTWVTLPSAAFSLGYIMSSAQPEWTFNFLTNQNFYFPFRLYQRLRTERRGRSICSFCLKAQKEMESFNFPWCVKHQALLSLSYWFICRVW